MKVKYLILVIMVMFSINVISAETIGQRQDAQLNSPYIISYPCATCTYGNISVYNKDGVVLNNVAIINNGSAWTYTFTPNTSLRHDVNGKGDINGIDDSFAFWFDVTLSGEQNNNVIIISDIILLLAIMGLLIMIARIHSRTDFDNWNEKIMDKHKNAGQTMVNGLVYSLFKNVFIWYYFLGWILVLTLKDVIYRFNSVEIYEYFTLFAGIYSLGMFLVVIFMIGYTISYMQNMFEILADREWGVGE